MLVSACIVFFAVTLPTQAVEASPASRISFTGVQGHYLVAAGSNAGTVVGEVRATNSGSVAALTYSLTAGSGLAIDSTSGVLSIADSASLAVSTQRSFEVMASDGTNSLRARFNLLVMPSNTLVHGVTEQRWDAVKGTGVDDVKIAMDNGRTPSKQGDIPRIDQSGVGVDSYGAKYSGFVVAPSTGSYTFWISGDDAAALWVGTNGSDSTFSQKPTASIAKETSRWSWGVGTSQQSAQVNLVAGQVYAIKVVHKEHGWGEHVAVAWKGPGMAMPVNGSATNVIPQSALYPVGAIDWSPPPKPAHASVSKITATSVTLSWRSVIDVSGIVRYVIVRDGRKIADVAASGATLYHFEDVIKPGVHRYAISAVDGKGNVSQPAVFTNVSSGRTFDPVESAVASGDPSWLTDSGLVIAAAQAEIASLLAKQNNLMSELYSGVASMNYIPASSGGSTIMPFGPASDRVLPIVKANNTAGSHLAAGGTTTTGSRFAAFGDSPLTEGNSASAIRLVQWLITGSGGASPSTASTIAILNNKSTDMKKWLIAKGIGSDSSITVCAAANYASCFVGKSLIIGGSKLLTDPVAAAPGMVAAIKQATAAQIPILWSADFGWPSDKTQDLVLPLLGAQYTGSSYGSNYPQAVFTTTEAVAAMAAVTDPYTSLKTMLAHFAADDWNVDFAGFDCYGCSANPTAQTYLTSEFFGGAKFLQSKLTDLDTRGIDLFDSPPAAYRLLKILVMLGDVYRRDVTFPAPATGVPNSRFFRTYFADFSVSNLRKYNPAQRDLGTFAWPIPANVPRFNDTRTFDTKTERYFTAVGSYAHPGQAFTVTRTDSTPVVIEVGINTVRPTSTHEFTSYPRPKYLRSPWIVLEKGVPLTITSPHGGPIQIRVASYDPSVNVSIALTNVGHHPVWDGPETTDVFSAGMAQSVYNWAEIKTPGIEIHSNRRLMLDTLQTTAFNTPVKLASSTFKYHFQSQYGVAGYVGDGLGVSSSVQTICTDNGLDCANRSINKVPAISHFNADKGSCGYGCSGNPYDADWAYSVIGWGDSHEIGHNIQRFMIYDGKSTETSNDIYSAHTLGKWNKEVPYYWQGAAFSTKPGVTFDAIVRAQASNDPIEFMKDVVWGTMQTAAARLVPEMQWDVQRMHFYWHLVQQSRENQVVKFGNDGWDFWTLMNAIDREFYYVSSDQARWDARATSIGFGGMTRDAARLLNNNSRTLVQASRLAKLDQRPFFDMWGVTYSAEASLQVASFNYAPAPKRYWYYPTTFEGSAYFSGVAAGSLPVDGSVTSLPVVPVAFNFTHADISSSVYPWPQIKRVAVKKSIDLKTAIGAASVVEFKANGVVIPECSAVPTQTHDWRRDYNNKAGGQGGGAQEVVATCVWYPQTAGSFVITTRVTPNNTTLGQPVTDPITITAYDTDDLPAISSVSSTMGIEGSTVILRGVNLRTTSTVTYKGVNVPIIARSATRITVAIPSVTPEQVNDYFTLFTTSGYRVKSRTQFVVRKPVTSVVLGASKLTINPGKVVMMASTVNPSFATNKSLAWSSSNPSVATVSPAGRIVGRQVGTAIITANAVDNAQFDSVALTVTSEQVIDVLALTGSPMAVNVGAMAAAQVSSVPSNATATSTVWTSASSAIASVTPSGMVTGVALGSTTLTATSANGVSTTVAVTVNVAVTSDDVTNTIPGLTNQMQFTINNGTTWNTFTGTNLPSLAGNIIVKVRALGTTTPVKTLLFTDGINSVTNPATIVVPGNVYLSDMTPTSDTSGWGHFELDTSNSDWSTGDGKNLTIKGVTYAKGLGVHSDSTITYNLDGKYSHFRADVGIDDSAAGAVIIEVLSGTEVLFAPQKLAKGDVAKVLNVNISGRSTLTLKVTKDGWSGGDELDWAGARLVPSVGSVTLSPQSALTTPGSVTTLVGVPVVESGVAATLTWTSSNTNVATVDANGVVTSVANGTAIITATSSIGSASANSVIRVGPLEVKSLVLSENSLLLAPTGSVSLTATVTKDVGAGFSLVWTSSNPSVAAVDPVGEVQAKSAGLAVITVATSDGAFEASAVVTVAPLEAATTVFNWRGESVGTVGTEFENRPNQAPDEAVSGGGSLGVLAGITESGERPERVVANDAAAPIAAGDVTVITNVLRVEILGRHLRIRSQSGTIFNSKAIITARYFDRKRKMVFTCVITGVSARKPKTQCLMPKSLQKAAKQRRAVFQIRTG